MVGEEEDIRLQSELGQRCNHSCITYTTYWKSYTSFVELEYTYLVELKTGKFIDLVTSLVRLYDHQIYCIIVDTNYLERISEYNIVLLTLLINCIDIDRAMVPIVFSIN